FPHQEVEVGVQLVESSGESQDMTLTVLTATPTERGPCERLYKLVAVSVGLLCILQAAANIGLQKLSNFGEYVDETETILTTLKEKNTGWVYFDQSFYYISSSQMSWQDSRDDCLQNGSNLIIITSKEEQVCEINGPRDGIWIGLTDTETEGTWKWVDGTEPKERYWTTGEPNSYQGSNEDCGEIRFYEEQHNWNDLECSYKNFWICEKALAQ
uniref:C-type lectin domain-containing protein n=1 Tax=Gasterosteus aculeatus aculeatus TaxID=481459 RepID=A0AAQ4P7E9_GASAC